ncbi:UDP-N-acetylmuramate: L-alanyl-gamma-D-glutamyl-meso-diaminopimelate ligase [Alteromonadaceae bacterium Bs31]|nr:UDP-N-acetylmuramate: L-alanyl-gamma-D-glutamyl-meso-diaminopimelate ligase [Alteromonadaceae bacterium Bs31]
MGSLAQLARAAGHKVTGCDVAVYPPMSDQLEKAGIELIEGFSPEQLTLNADQYVVGNVISRGNPLMEAILNKGLRYISGPQWLSEHILQQRWTLAVAGTHGKTTTASMLAWILDYAGMSPGYLIGGVPSNFSVSASLGGSDFFVIEADEYDTAFFDKRSKFLHYQPNTLVINNLEYDHADIFPDLAAIQRQFHHLLRILPGEGLVIYPEGCKEIDQVLEQGCWSESQSMATKPGRADWTVSDISPSGASYTVNFGQSPVGEVSWALSGLHNVSNGLSAIAAARHVGVLPALACEALCEFNGVKRRLELVGQNTKVLVYDDFAHHPTAIATTLDGLRAKVGDERIFALIEPRSNTMKQGVHQSALSAAIAAADRSFWFEAGLQWSLEDALSNMASAERFSSTESIIDSVCREVGEESSKVHIVIMSNGGFEGIHQRLWQRLQELAE